MRRKFLKEIYYVGNIYKLSTWKYGIFVDINNRIGFCYYGSVREALNFIYDYSEFCLGKLILKGSEVWEDKYINEKTYLEVLNDREYLKNME